MRELDSEEQEQRVQNAEELMRSTGSRRPEERAGDSLRAPSSSGDDQQAHMKADMVTHTARSWNGIWRRAERDR